jgi:hypothetical protein
MRPRPIRWGAWLAVAATVALGSGCAVGNRYAYHSVVAEPRLSGRTAVTIATHDQREYVRNGNKDPQFVGLQRGGFGNPFDVRTEDDRPLADAMTDALVATLARRGFRATAVAVTPALKADEVFRRLAAGGAPRGLLLTLQEWKSDTMMNVALIYDVTLVVLDQGGAVLASKRIAGRDNLGGDAWNPPSHARSAVPQAFKRKLEELLDDPAVAAGLR